MTCYSCRDIFRSLDMPSLIHSVNPGFAAQQMVEKREASEAVFDSIAEPVHVEVTDPHGAVTRWVVRGAVSYNSRKAP